MDISSSKRRRQISLRHNANDLERNATESELWNSISDPLDLTDVASPIRRLPRLILALFRLK